MAGGLKELCFSRIQRAQRELPDAELLLENGSFHSSINRSYYAIFHAVRAVNALDGFDSSKHSGVIAHFNHAHVANGDFPKETSKLIQTAFKLRSESDYDDFFQATQENASDALENAKLFVHSANRFLSEQLSDS